MKKCPRCDVVTDRWGDRACLPCLAAAARARRCTNGDVLRARDRERYYRDKTKRIAQKKAYYLKNREKVLAQVCEYRQRNRNKALAWMRAWYERNRVRAIAKAVEWSRANRELVKVYQGRRRAAKLKTAAPLQPKEWQTILQRYSGCCAYCGTAAKITMDHVVPLVRGGAHSADNVVPACWSCNSRKGVNVWEPRQQEAATTTA